MKITEKLSIHTPHTLINLTWSLCLLFFLTCATQAAESVLSLPHIFSDNMVLQREMPVPVWGTAARGEAVKVKFGNQEKNTTADANGLWMVKLDPMKADKTGRELVVTGKTTLTYSNVLVGEVWLCSGQSNMTFGLRGFSSAKGNTNPTDGVLNFADEIKATVGFPMIREIKIPQVHNAFPQKDVEAKWQVVDPETAGGCTAVGYFFARELVKNLDVPIGLLDSNWGGTRIEAWTPREGFATVPELKDLSDQVNQCFPDNDLGQKRYKDYITAMKDWLVVAEQDVNSRRTPPESPAEPWLSGDRQQLTHLYNNMINPLIPFAFRGAIWYQGEANGTEGESYYHKMQALIDGWRHLWKQGSFPFYYVQLANFQQSSPDKPEMGDGWAKVREAQMKALNIPNTGMAVTLDVGESRDIHPKNKQDVGKRLAAWALAKNYGKKIEYSGPLYKKFQVDGNKIRISFDHADSGLMLGEKKGLEPVQALAGGKLAWVSVAGEDKKFYWADAVIDGKTLVVSCDQVSKPVAVRYAFACNPQGAALYNKDGLPASPFRTDNW